MATKQISSLASLVTAGICHLCCTGKIDPASIHVEGVVVDLDDAAWLVNVEMLARVLDDRDLVGIPHVYSLIKAGPKERLDLMTKIIVHDIADTNYGRREREEFEVWHSVTARMVKEANSL